ncbi:ATP-binding cassette domain-containing protein [Pseudodesulfovibrio sp. JC047]|uniref:ABC transporter ATP-binding protein n=1 Tax=Pseudodesulfovibrio sp. JC047 TaxID=2683199 RepID=UPI0013D412E5|nr:ABC transporter ATP-binding protein [Pseudodesulfovibrio sp. JC047]NDV20346.1 ATP-binding cassette domain-containing protein [Pseudodesulfovibrio sp. JC047]
MCLTLDAVSFTYPNGPTILRHASLTFEQGAFFLVRGPSGSGKSTLLRILCRLEEIQSGSIHYKDHDITDIPPASLRRCVAYVQQMPTLLPGTVRDNLLLPFTFQSNKDLCPPSDLELSALLESFLLSGVTLDSEADRLSVGQSQRICLIRSLLLRPEVILLDEPTASLDPESARVVLNKAAELSREGITVIMISHSEETPEGVTRLVSFHEKKLVLQ